MLCLCVCCFICGICFVPLLLPRESSTSWLWHFLNSFNDIFEVLSVTLACRQITHSGRFSNSRDCVKFWNRLLNYLTKNVSVLCDSRACICSFTSTSSSIMNSFNRNVANIHWSYWEFIITYGAKTFCHCSGVPISRLDCCHNSDFCSCK